MSVNYKKKFHELVSSRIVVFCHLKYLKMLVPHSSISPIRSTLMIFKVVIIILNKHAVKFLI